MQSSKVAFAWRFTERKASHGSALEEFEETFFFSLFPFGEGCCYSLSKVNLAWRKIAETLGSKNCHEPLENWQTVCP